LAPEPAFVSGHEPRLHQVLTNLVANAAEAIQPVGGTLTIATERVEGSVAAGEPFHVRAGRLDERHYVCVRVSDTGRGIPPALIGRIFQPGFTTKPSGHGDGLPSVRKIVEAYGGAVTATSLPDRGTTVCVYLPSAAPHGEGTAASVAVSSPPTVLLVDDHDNTRNSSKFLLESRECGNFEVLACATGRAALESLQTRLADVAVAVLDMNLPDVKGIDLLAALRQIKPALPIIAVSGFGRDHFAWERAIEQPDVFLPKPFDVAELAAKLDEVLRGGACPLN
jgi:two-component system, cell cycle sensor histidine kinase and response regulator CckA